LTQKSAISIAVLSRTQDDVQQIDSTLRRAGHPTRCLWVQTPGRFADTLQKESLELIVINVDQYPDPIRQVVREKEPFLPEVPVIAIAGSINEADILASMQSGACDLVSTRHPARLLAVVIRELRACRVERALNATLSSANEYRRQLKDYMQNSPTAIAYVQEGIVTDTNSAWLKLFRAGDGSEVVGLPLMDSFHSESHAAVKGALIAASRGKWQAGEVLLARSSHSENSKDTLELGFRLVALDEGPHIQISIAPRIAVVEEPTKLVHDALQRDPTTLLFHRAQFIERIGKRLQRSPKSGTYALAFIKPDNFSEIRSAVGYIDSEDILAQLAEAIRKRMHPRDFAGRFEGTVIMALLERGSERDAEVWGRQLVDNLQKHCFTIGDRQVSVTCTVGVTGISGVFGSLEEVIAAAAEAHRQGKEKGGNTSQLLEARDESTRLRKYDEMWVARIKAALQENRFRLAQLPIAGLRSDSNGMCDVLIRLIDEQGDTVVPSEFLPAANRNNLMKTIDRWMLSASMDFARDNNMDKVLIRLSRQSMQDPMLAEWLGKELGKRRCRASSLVIQITEQEAARFIKETLHKVSELRKLGVGFALEHYGLDKNRLQILDILKPNFIKLDGELMHSLMTDTSMQAAVSQLAAAASERKIETIAERVENANEMAVLFQLGVHYMQGHYVHEPEVVLQDPVQVVTTTLDAIGAG
jgi:diguanylate cyclase (GGDEF)-like protein